MTPARLGGVRRSKYGNTKVTEDGYVFDSRKEHRRYRELRLLEQAGEITHLCVHPKFDLLACRFTSDGDMGQKFVGHYTPDFSYRDQRNGGVTVVEDVKASATKTEAYRLRKRIVEANYNIVVSEV